jgi:hypothetical protein
VHPEQITLGTCKFTIDPLPSGPQIEFTDFATDITWLSGPIFAGSGAVHPRLSDVDWKATEKAITISGALGELAVEIAYELQPLARLVERIAIFNPTNHRVEIADIRVGATWTPPLPWWAPWSDWHLVMVCAEGRSALGRSLSTLMELLDLDKPPLEPVRVIPEQIANAGWIFSDARRFLVIAKDEGSCPLDIFHQPKQPPGLVMGGLERREPVIFDARSSLKTVTFFMPGQGDVIDAYTSLAL